VKAPKLWVLMNKKGKPCKWVKPSWTKKDLIIERDIFNIVDGDGTYSIKRMKLVEE
jgi:hypothetical protein